MTTLPGDIPGLLRNATPVCQGDRRGVVLVVEAPRVWVAWANGRTSATLEPVSRADLALDLADPTGRAHAAWWLIANGGTVRTVATMKAANSALHCSPECDVEALRLACLYAAGRLQ